MQARRSLNQYIRGYISDRLVWAAGLLIVAGGLMGALLLSPIGRNLAPTGSGQVRVATQPPSGGRIVLQLVITPANSPYADTDFTFQWTPATIGEWGSESGGAGSGEPPGPGTFAMPNGAAVAPDGTVYVADSANHRIQKFTASGAFLSQIGTTGSAGSGQGAFNFPAGVAVDGAGNLYVADFFNHRIQVFDDEGTFLRAWGSAGTGDGQFDSPVGVAVEGNRVYVSDFFNHRVQVFEPDGDFVAAWGATTPGVPGTGPGEFNFPSGIVIPGTDPSGTGSLHVTDSYNDRVQRLDADGNFVTAWGAPGAETGAFNYPHGIALDGAGYLYVVDTYNRRVQKFDGAGAFVSAFGSEVLSRPTGIALSAIDGRAYVADASTHSIHLFLAGSATLDGDADDGDAYHESIAIDELPAGVYTTGETVPEGWALVGVSCVDGTGAQSGAGSSDGPDVDVSFVLAAGGVTTCTVTHEAPYVPPVTQTLTVEKVVAGGPLDAEDFTLLVDGSPVARGAPVELSAASHTVSETAVVSYTATFGGACDGDGVVLLGTGQHRTCVITNTYAPLPITQTLTVEKVVADGPLNADDFTLLLDGDPVVRGAPVELSIGAHTVSETLVATYTATFGGACDSAGTVLLGAGERLTCTLTNTYTITDTITDEIVPRSFLPGIHAR